MHFCLKYAGLYWTSTVNLKCREFGPDLKRTPKNFGVKFRFKGKVIFSYSLLRESKHFAPCKCT